MRVLISIIMILLFLLSCKADKSRNKVLAASVPLSFTGKVKLIEERCCPPGCGVIAWAIAQKFLVIRADFEQLEGKEIIIIERCPEFKGKNFFKTGEFYQVKTSNQFDSVFSVINFYEKEKLLTYWSEDISLTK